jgi:hypothetical protein
MADTQADHVTSPPPNVTSRSRYHFDLSFGDPQTQFTFHKRGKVYPIRRHTQETRGLARAEEPLLERIPDERLTHFVEGVEVNPATDGVTFQAVKKSVEVDGPDGPNTQTYDQLVTYAISIPGNDEPHIGTNDLAYALIFMHNNLLNVNRTEAFTIPTFILNNCIKPHAGDLVQQLENLILSGEKWIGDPYPVMVKDAQGNPEHLVYPKDDPKAGQWVYSQKLNDSALQPGMSSSLGAALRAAKNAKELEGHTWNVQNAVLSSDYDATQHTGSAARDDLRVEGDAGSVQWTVKNLTPGSGLSVDASSLSVDMSKDTDHAGYQGQLSLECTNHWLRHLSAYVQFLKYQGEGADRKLVSIDLGSSNTPIPYNGGTIYANTVWPGDFVDADDYFWQGMGFVEPSHTEKFLKWVDPTGTICGIPVPVAPTTFNVHYIPTDANVVRLLWGGLGRGPYDSQVCAVGITFTAIFELALPVILLMYDASTADASKLTESVWQHKGVMFNLAKTIAEVIMNSIDLEGKTMAAQNAEAIGKFLAESLLPDLLRTGVAFGAQLMATIGVGEAMEAIPFVDIAYILFNAAITAAELSQTVSEVAQSPFVFETDISRTFDVSLTINPDEHMHEFPPEAIGGTYKVVINFSENSTPAVFEYSMPPTTWSDPIQVEFKKLPAGGQVQIHCFMYSTSGWQAGQGKTAWMDGKGNKGSTLVTELTVTNNDPPLGKFSVYEFVEKTVYENGARIWRGVKSTPPATKPTATRQTQTHLTELNGISICQDAGMLGYTFQTHAETFTVENISLLQHPQSAFASRTGLTVMPGLAYQRLSKSDGSGLNFYLDATPANNPDGGCHLRRLKLVFDENTHRSLPPDLDPDPGKSWGRFPFPLNRAIVHGNYVAGISFDTNHSKIFVLKVPAEPMDLDKAPKAVLVSGPGTREGLISIPRGIAFGMEGQILVLEEGNRRVQAFDVHGNPYACFDATGSGTKQSVFSLEEQSTPTTCYLDLAVEPKGYVYVLSYDNEGATADDYHLDLYEPHGKWLARTKGFAAASICVDIIRDLYTQNYELLENAPDLEPSVSLWLPPVKPNS